MISYLEFEKPVAALEARLAELRASTYAALTPWQKTQVARHPMRPHFTDYVELMFDEFVPLGGDRLFGEDEAILGGFATFRARKIMLIGHEKGTDTQSRIKHNFGMGTPEGYRKAIRLMDMAGRFGLPVVTLVDTSGAFPGVEAEERGQAEAIARSTEACLALPTPMVATIVGDGGSGGAVALASAERVLMLEHAVYSVISPEGCASILWRTADKAAQAAEAMKMTAQDIKQLGVIDRIVPEPVGGAQRDPAAAAAALGKALGEELDKLASKKPAQLRKAREERLMSMAAG